MTITDTNLLSLDELAAMLDEYAGPAQPRPRRARRRWQPRRAAWAGAVAMMTLAGAAYAAGLEPFAGIGAADHPRAASDVLDPALVTVIERGNPLLGKSPTGKRLPETARFITQLASGARIYTLSTTTNELCVLIQPYPGTSDGVGTGCGDPLSQSQPTTVATISGPPTPALTFGVARDGVTAVSFLAGGAEQTVSVTNNVWAYEGNSEALSSITVHYDDGTTQTITHR